MKSKLKLSGERILIFVYLFILVIGIAISYNKEEPYVNVFAMPATNKTIIIDAGHGGWDPGMVAADSTLEKDINTAIALKLQQYLEQGDCRVIMTRVDDSALGPGKTSDMKGRKEISNTNDGDLLVSIHQNSFPQANVSGAQVFYYDKSGDSKVLAESIQTQLKEYLSQNNNRVAKANDNYYMLKQTAIPAVIIECGFLSNTEEKNMLLDEQYQQKVAWAIYAGIMDYLYKPVNQ